MLVGLLNNYFFKNQKNENLTQTAFLLPDTLG